MICLYDGHIGPYSMNTIEAQGLMAKLGTVRLKSAVDDEWVDRTLGQVMMQVADIACRDFRDSLYRVGGLNGEMCVESADGGQENLDRFPGDGKSEESNHV